MSRKSRAFVVLYALALLGGLVYVFLMGKGTEERADEVQRNVTFDIRQSQFDACANSPLREQVRKEFVDLKQDVLIPILESTGAVIRIQPHPDKPPIDAVRYLRQRISTIEERIPDPNCRALYPALEGQDLESPDPEKPAKESTDDPQTGPTDDAPLGPPAPGDTDGGSAPPDVGAPPSSGGSSDPPSTGDDAGPEDGGDQPAPAPQPAPDPTPVTPPTVGGLGVQTPLDPTLCSLPVALCP